MRVLIVDDNMINLMVTMRLLSKYGIKCDTASGHKQVGELDISIYDLILMDIQMPEKDGYQLSGELKEKYGTACPPIIPFSANEKNDVLYKSVENGMDGFLGKPFNIDKFIEVLKSLELDIPSQTSAQLQPED